METIQNRGNDANAPPNRVISACRRCRLRKVKCSGTQPCSNCERRRQTCAFDKVERKVVVSERRLRELERRVSRVGAREQHSSQTFPPPAPVDVSQDIQSQVAEAPTGAVHGYRPHSPNTTTIPPSGSPAPFLNPSGPRDSSRHEDTNRNNFTWEFCRAAHQALRPVSDEGAPSPRTAERITYNFATPLELQNVLTWCDLPSKSFMNHLAQVVDFHLNATCFFFNLSNLREEIATSEVFPLPHTPSIFHARILAVIAMGKLLLKEGATTSGPPGIREFLQAIRVLPSNVVLYQSLDRSLETLALLAMYAQAADLHGVAYLYVGQAVRLGRILEMGRSAPSAADMDAQGPSNLQKLWWTIHILDQKLAATVGASPDCQSSSRVEDILSWVFAYDDTAGAALRAHLCVVTLMSSVASVQFAYYNKSIKHDDFKVNITSQFVTARKIGQALSTSQQLCGTPALTSISRSVATLHLLYCQVVLFGTKPFLMSTFRRCSSQDRSLTRTPTSDPLLQFLKTNLGAAAHCLNIIFALREQGVIETFLSLDLEVAFMAGLSLALANPMFPNLIDPSYLSSARHVLQDMKHCGNIPAGALLNALNEVCDLVANLSWTQTASLLPQFEPPLRMTHDGNVLNTGLVDMVKIEPSQARYSEIEPSQLQPPKSQAPVENHSFYQESREPLRSRIDSNLMLPVPPASGNSVAQSDAIFLDYFHESAINLDSDITNSDWLDFL